MIHAHARECFRLRKVENYLVRVRSTTGAAFNAGQPAPRQVDVEGATDSPV